MLRRNFLRHAATGAIGIQAFLNLDSRIADELGQFRSRLNATKEDSEFWDVVLGEFQVEPGVTHLNCGTIGACPKIVTESLVRLVREIEKDPYRNTFGNGLYQQLENVRGLAANFLGATSSEVAITRNTTEGMNIIARGLDLDPDDEILTTNHEHPGGIACWRYLQQRMGAKIVRLELPAPVTDPEEILKLLRQNISPRTKVFSFCHVDTITGALMPITAIAQIAQQQGIFFACDGAQAPGMLDVDVKSLGVDAYVSSSHKWLLAPKGSGLLYIKQESQNQLQTLELSSGFNIYSASIGTRDIAKILAHGIAIQFHEAIGPKKIEQRVRQLNRYLRIKLSKVSSLRLLSPSNSGLSSGIATYVIDNTQISSSSIARQLCDESRIYVKHAQSTNAMNGDRASTKDYNALRFSTHIFNNEVQIDDAVNAVQRLLG